MCSWLTLLRETGQAEHHHSPLLRNDHPLCISFRKIRHPPVIVYPSPSHQCNFATDVILPCHVLNFPDIQEQTLMQILHHRHSASKMNHPRRGIGHILHELLNYAGQTKAVSSFPCITSSMHQFQMPRSHAILRLSISAACCQDESASYCLHNSPAKSNHSYFFGPGS